MSPPRRAALIDWAERGDRLIIEDDYDSELCRERVGALQGLAPDRVLYIGSASKRLAPRMRLRYAQRHRTLVAALERELPRATRAPKNRLRLAPLAVSEKPRLRYSLIASWLSSLVSSSTR